MLLMMMFWVIPFSRGPEQTRNRRLKNPLA
jgi:hypothetical protein